MKLTSEEAFVLARRFRELSVALGDYRFTKWAELKPAQRRYLEDVEWTLLNASSDMITTAVGLVLDESQMNFAALDASAGNARAAVQKLEVVRKVVLIAAAAVRLAASVVAKEPLAVVKNAKALIAAAAAV